MPAALFEEWRALYDCEPWADERADLAVGQAISYTAAFHNVAPKAPREYMELLRTPPKPQTQDDLMRTWTAVCEIRGRMLANEKATDTENKAV